MHLIALSDNQELVQEMDKRVNVGSESVKEAFLAAGETTWLAVKLWAHFVIVIVAPISHETFVFAKVQFLLVQPKLILCWEYFLNTHWTTKVTLLGIVLGVVLVFVLQREIRKRRYFQRVYAWFKGVNDGIASRYRSFVDGVRQKSRTLADLLPHLLFIFIGGSLVVLFPEALAEFSIGLGGWMVVTGFPLIFGVRSLILYDRKYSEHLAAFKKSKPNIGELEGEENTDAISRARNAVSTVLSSALLGTAPPETGKARAVEQVYLQEYNKLVDSQDTHRSVRVAEISPLEYWVKYWTVVGVVLLLEKLPLTGHAVAMLPFWSEFCVVWSMWLQIPGTSGAVLAFRVIVPLIEKYLGQVQGANMSTEQRNMLANLLCTFHIISNESSKKLTEILYTGGTLLLCALPFLFMPAAITSIGASLIGIGRPILEASRALYSLELASKTPLGKPGPSLAVACSECTRYLEYWIAYTLIMLVHQTLDTLFYIVPFWTHSLLVLTLWLQLPYFNGAHRVFQRILFVYSTVSGQGQLNDSSALLKKKNK